jgi:hypothetical protein
MNYDEILGMDIQEAAQFLTSRGVRWRISAENGRSVILTADYDQSRLNISIVNGKVSSYRFG